MVHMAKPILIDVTRLLIRLSQLKRPTGIDRVCLAYVAHFNQRAQAVVSFRTRVVVLSPQHSQQLFAALIADQPIRSKRYWLSLLIRYLTTAYSNLQAYKGCYYFNLSHKGLESQAYIEKLKTAQLKPIFFIHDLIPITHPEYCREYEDVLHVQRITRALTVASGVIVNSAYTQHELNIFAAQHHLKQPSTAIAWLSCQLDSLPALKPQVSIPNSAYFVLLSTIEARKNHLTLLQVWLKLIEKFGQDCPKLVLIGQRGWECEQVIDLLDRCPRLQDHIIEVNQSNDADLIRLLQNSRALILPSFVEGFGIPLVEALSLGVPVLASDIAVFREIGQNIPDFIDPIDAVCWQSTIENYLLTHSDRRNSQLNRLNQYQHWQWSDHFNCVENFLNQLDSKEL